MAPSRKRKSDEMAEPTTPEASNTPAPKKMRITQTQKQALIDNLQLEISQRARHLRAHYALQCADLKSRIERRVNRIPMSLRTMTMAELMERHNPAPEPPAKPIVVHKTQPAAVRPIRKRKSSIVIAADSIQESANENENESTITAAPTRPVPLPKTRTATRPGSRTGKATGTAGVLSPRSHNSRTIPRSPIKNTTTTSTENQIPHAPPSPSKSHSHMPPTRPMTLSPIKPASPLKSAAMATSSAITTSMHNLITNAKSTATRSKNAARALQTRTASQASTYSIASTSTTTSTGTVMKAKDRPARGRAGATAAAVKKLAAANPHQENPGLAMAAPPVPEKGLGNANVNSVSVPPRTKSRAATTTGTAKKVTIATVKKVTTEPAAPAAGRRILRKRN